MQCKLNNFSSENPEEESVIKDLSHWEDYLNHQSQDLEKIIDRKLAKLESYFKVDTTDLNEEEAKDLLNKANLLKMEVLSFSKVMESFQEYRAFIMNYLPDLETAYLDEKAKRENREAHFEELRRTFLIFRDALLKAREELFELKNKEHAK